MLISTKETSLKTQKTKSPTPSAGLFNVFMSSYYKATLYVFPSTANT